MLGKKLPHLRKIKLYTNNGGYIYLPKGFFNNKLKSFPKNYLEENFEYKGEFYQEQVEILGKIKDRRNGLIDLKTGKGKSHIIMGLILQKQERTLVLVHSIKTLKEMEEKFKKFTNYIPGLYYGKKKEIKEITITTHQSFMTHSEKFEDFSLLIYDEADYNLSVNMRDRLNLFPSSSLFGLTATPETQEIEKEDMKKIFGEIIKVESSGENDGYNFIPDIYRIPYNNSMNFSFDSWHELREMLMKNEERQNYQIKIIKNADFNYGLLLTERIEEAKNYYEKIKEELDIPISLFIGETKQKDDEQNLKYMRQFQKYLIIGTSGKVGRGMDIPEIDSIFLFFPCQFKGTVVQAVGRGLRNSPNKEKVNLYDWCDYPILAGQAKKRLKAYKEEYPKAKVYLLNYKNE